MNLSMQNTERYAREVGSSTSNPIVCIWRQSINYAKFRYSGLTAHYMISGKRVMNELMLKLLQLSLMIAHRDAS